MLARLRPAVALAFAALALAIPVASAQAATTKGQAIARVTRILSANRAACEMTLGRVSATRAGRAWRVTARVTTFGNAGTASWWVQRAGGRVSPANQLASEIEVGCP
jgi:hypothetical protein